LKENDLEKIERYVSGVADDSEKAWVESLFLNGEENDSLRHLLANDWDSLLRDSSSSEVDLSYLLDRVQHIIRKKEHQKKQTVFRRFMRVYMKAAAILLLPLMVAGGLVYSFLTTQDKPITDQQVSSTIYAPLGARVSFNLPDGTTGMLNSGSHLSYSLPFNNSRKISLEGEAWFDVIKDEDYPFEINTGTSAIRVLGTSFNLSAYPAENSIEVVLKDGQVEFFANASTKKVTLASSERLVFRNGKISRSVTDPSKYSAWTEGKMVFNNDPMAEVARRIERWYNVKVVLADKELEKYSFRGTFEDDKLEEVFRLLALTSPIRYKITPRKLLSDGTYEKEKVTIYLKKR
jgi:ferric-dicitrate binding protein FerR (iron transport regulator)